MHTKNEIVSKCYVHTTNEIVTKCNGSLILDNVLFLVVFCRLEGEDRAKAGRERKGKGNHLQWIAAWWGVTMRSQAYYTTPNRVNTGMEWNCNMSANLYPVICCDKGTTK